MGKIRQWIEWIGGIVLAILGFVGFGYLRGKRKESADEAQRGRDQDRAKLSKAVKEGDDETVEDLWRRSQR